METELRCNRLTCRQALVDKAVVTTCSHIFCINCANQLFTAAQICPACETSLTEADDCVIASLHPTNDYKTSVLSGLSPSTILEICGRAIAFWSYQIQQEQAFQQAVLKNASEKTSQLQKQLDNVIREAHAELGLLNTKVTNAERELEQERRKIRELQESSLSKDKEYAKLKSQYDKIKRKALLNPSVLSGGQTEIGPTTNSFSPLQSQVAPAPQNARNMRSTPVREQQARVGVWSNPNAAGKMSSVQRQPFGAGKSLGMSVPDVSTEEVEAMLGVPISRNQVPAHPFSFRSTSQNLRGPANQPHLSSHHNVLATPTTRRSGGGFRPAGGYDIA